MPDTVPPISLYLRRHDEQPPRFALRFVTNGGRAMLRVRKEGVLLATPAGERGFEDALEAEAVVQAELIWTARDARLRSCIRLHGLSADACGSLEADTWHSLELVAEGPDWHAQIDPLDGSSSAPSSALALGGSLLHDDAPPVTEEARRPAVSPGLLADLANTASERGIRTKVNLNDVPNTLNGNRPY